jgi:nucleoid-associated protein YgaU
MRKDLKIGMAIGAVLLVVLIVYLAVPDTQNDVAQNTGADEQVTETESGASEAPAVEETPVAEAKEPAAPADTTETASADPRDPFESQGTMWAKILEDGQLPTKTITPSLRATNTEAPAAEAAAPAAEESATAEPAPTAADETVTAVPDTESKADASEAVAEKSTEAPTESKSGTRTHTIKAGEDFSKIARDAYGNARHYLAIMKANPTLDPTRLKVGTVITLPDISSASAEPTVKSNSAVTVKRDKELDPEKEYRIQSGDSLYRISMKHYGTSNMVEALYEANKATIGNDSSRLKLGMVIKLPPSPNAQAASR